MSRHGDAATVISPTREPRSGSPEKEYREDDMNPLMYGDQMQHHTADMRNEADKHRMAMMCRPRCTHTPWTWPPRIAWRKASTAARNPTADGLRISATTGAPTPP
jgi:hypothetical protein